MGNTLRFAAAAAEIQDHPHLRGEYGLTPLSASLSQGSPPLAWGIRIVACCDSISLGITPTCVGNTQLDGVISPWIEDHPHLRGEYTPPPSLDRLSTGSPPLAWGIRGRQFIVRSNDRITPTCVGNTRCISGADSHSRDHPHLRGEYIGKTLLTASCQGSPPLAWGILRKGPANVTDNGITPTCVGNTAS